MINKISAEKPKKAIIPKLKVIPESKREIKTIV
jgi:hypothetical protein